MSASPASVCPKCEPLVASALAAELAREGAAARVELEKQRERVAELEAELRSLRLELAVRSSSGPPMLLSVPSASGSDISAPYSYTRSPVKRQPAYPRPPAAPPPAPPDATAAAADLFARLLRGELRSSRPSSSSGGEARQAATVLQAHLRGWRQRSRYAAARQVFAVVTGTSSLGAAGAWRDVPTYTITVIRAGCCWQVAHRYSDWRRLHRALQAAGAAPPPLPSRLPFGGASVVERRTFALNRYLQRLLPLACSSARPRAVLIAFLTSSHLYWEYDLAAAPTRGERAAPAFADAAAVYDRSTGTTAQSHTQGVVTPSPVSSLVTVSSTTTSLGTGRASGLPWQRQPGRTESESSRAGV